MHTSPLDQPGTGDAGGMNVYLSEVSARLAARGIAVEIFTRATSSDLPDVVELFPGVHVRHIPAGPFEGDNKKDLPGQLCTFVGDVLRTGAARDPGYYDVVHSHYWLSGQVGRIARRRWGVPLIHTAHTLGRVKNALTPWDEAEPGGRIEGEKLIVEDADALIANTPEEAEQLATLYRANHDKIHVVTPGVDLAKFHPGDQYAARAELGFKPDEYIVLFVGRLQLIKGPDILVRAAASLAADSALHERLRVVICGGTSGEDAASRQALEQLGQTLNISEVLTFLEPRPAKELARLYQAADVTVVPSRSESFGLVAVESQACGTPVVAAEVGGLRTAVSADISGILVAGHDPVSYADVLRELDARPEYRAQLASGGVAHTTKFSWESTTTSLLNAYNAAFSTRATSLVSV